MSKDKLVDSFTIDPNLKWKIDESKEDSVVDGINILGRAVGPMFAPDGHSLNKRFYPKELWERAINENGDRLTYGEMLGTIGHDQPLDDQALLEGKASHKVTKLWIDEDTKVGMGEIQILSTPAGKVLNSYLRGGVRLKVSSRAMGEYKGKTKDGSQIIDEASFNLEGFDFVQRPGIPTAIPVLVEHALSNDDNDTNLNPKNPDTENKMSQEILESMTREKVKLENQLSEALTKVSTLESDKSALRTIIESKEKEVTRVEESLGERNRRITILESQVADLQTAVASFDKLGTAEEISTAIDNAEATIAAYREFGTPAELTEAFERVTHLIDDYNDIGSVDEINQTLDIIEQYTANGPVTEVNSKLELLKKYEALGEIDKITTDLALTESYIQLGTPEEISKAFEMTESIVNKFEEDTLTKEVEEISTKFGVKTATVESMITKHGKDETVNILESIKSTDVSDRYEVKNEEVKKDEIVESVEAAPASKFLTNSGRKKADPVELAEATLAPSVDPSRLSRLMNSFNK